MRCDILLVFLTILNIPSSNLLNLIICVSWTKHVFPRNGANLFVSSALCCHNEICLLLRFKKSLSCLYENRENYRIYCTQTDPIPALYIPILAKMHPLTCENAYFCKVREILAAELQAHALEAIQRGARKSDFYRPILEKFHNVPELAQVSLIAGYAPATSLRST